MEESVKEELMAVESILCQEGEFIRLADSCVRLRLAEVTWLTLGNPNNQNLNKNILLIMQSFNYKKCCGAALFGQSRSKEAAPTPVPPVEILTKLEYCI